MNWRKLILMAVLLGFLAGCNEPWSSGDRVLVQKNAYDIGVASPQRFQVVVFKWPEGPMDKNTPKNYIKRLLGLPGELLAIFFGRIYRWAPPENAPPPFEDTKNPKINPDHLWHKEFMHTDDATSRDWFEQGKFEIIRKPPQVLLALRRIVYDNDFQAKDLKERNFHRWTPAPTSSWKNDTKTGFFHDGGEGQIDWLRYQHRERPKQLGGDLSNEKPKLITDGMAYNTVKTFRGAGGIEEPQQSPHWVGDLMIECNVEVLEPKGEFLFELSKGHDRFQARWDLSSGKCTLLRTGKDGKAEEMANQTTSVSRAGNYMLRLANIDARLTVWVDRALPFGDGKEYDPPELLTSADKAKGLKWADIAGRHGPQKNDLEPASIGVKGAKVKVTHLRIWRDTYYTTSASGADYDHAPTTWTNPEDWEPVRKQRFATMFVQPGHYLCLGDNSQASSDSRQWGLVPERLMLGRALVVYYPFDRVGAIR